MIAADTSIMVAYFQGKTGADIEIVDNAIQSGSLILPPVVITELLAYPLLEKEIFQQILLLPLLEIRDGYWERTGQIRSIILSMKLKSRISDALIAQSCMDHDVSLVTRDTDFRHFEKYCGLKLI